VVKNNIGLNQALNLNTIPVFDFLFSTHSSRLISTANTSFVKVYTRAGDSGTSALFTGERRPKDDTAFEALGTIDELSSYLAVARELAMEANHPYSDRLQSIQCILQVL
jgi:cob(I)alamin adenosyltransferase